MKPRTTVATATSPDGTVLDLVEHDGDYLILANRVPLMSTRLHESEEELSRVGCPSLPPGARVLVGGLGMGYTLRAALDLLPEDGRVDQVELSSAVVEWNRGPLAPFAGHPLDDPRVELVQADVRKVVRDCGPIYDAILLDVDNGPSVAQREQNSSLYRPKGLRMLRAALRRGGRLAIWGARDEDPGFPERMGSVGFESCKYRVSARPGRKGGFHVIYLGVRREESAPSRPAGGPKKTGTSKRGACKSGRPGRPTSGPRRGKRTASRSKRSGGPGRGH